MILKTEDVKKIDKYAVEKLRIPEMVLMENAGIGLYNNVEDNKENILIICGRGNNGGDGLVLARQLLSRERKIKVYIFGKESQLKGSVKANYDILTKMDCRIKFINNKTDIEDFKIALGESDLVVDAIFGIGLSREIKGIYKDIIEAVNESKKEILAVDTPSGFNCSTGQIFNTCIKAKKTVTFISEKFGFHNKESKDYTGDVIVEQISIPKNIIEKILEE